MLVWQAQISHQVRAGQAKPHAPPSPSPTDDVADVSVENDEETSQVVPETPPYTPATDIISDDEPPHDDVDSPITQPSGNEGHEGDGEDTYYSAKDDNKDDDDTSHSDSGHYTHHSDKDDDKNDEKDHDTKAQDFAAAEREPVRANGPIRCNEFSRRLAIRVAYEKSQPDVLNFPIQTLDFYESWANSTSTTIRYPDEYGIFDSDDDNAYNDNDTKDDYDSDSSDKDDDEDDPNPLLSLQGNRTGLSKAEQLQNFKAVIAAHINEDDDDPGRLPRLRQHYVKVRSRPGLRQHYDPAPLDHSSEFYENWAWDRTQCNGTDYAKEQPDYRFEPDYDTEYDSSLQEDCMRDLLDFDSDGEYDYYNPPQ